MVNLQGTNPITGDSVNAASPRTWVRYGIGGIALVSGLMIGKFATDTASEATNIGDTVQDRVLSLS